MSEQTTESKVEFSDASNWLANLRALYSVDMQLAQSIDDLPESDYFELAAARNESMTAKVRLNDGREIFLHSRYDPQTEAKRFVDSLDFDNNFVFVVSGFGLGYHIRELFDRATSETIVVVLEPELYVIRTGLWNIDFPTEIKDNRLIFLNTADQGLLHKKLTPLSTTLTMGTALVAHPYSKQWHDKFHSEMREHISNYMAYCRMSFVTLIGNSKITQQNVVDNLAYYVCCPPIDILRRRFAGYPAIVVSAGPSLAKNIDLLKQAQGKAIIIAVQTTLKTLLKKGIKPDFVTSLDWSPISRRFFQDIDDFGDIHLIAEPKVSCVVPDTFTGRKSLLRNEFADMCIGSLAKQRDSLRAGSTVAHLAFYLAEFIGADPIVLVGQDLAFSDNLYYAPGGAVHEMWSVELNRFYTLEMKEWERIVRNRNILRKVKDINDKTIYTDEQMFSYLQQFERDFAQTSATVIDATEGGAKKRGTTIMTLKDTLDKYAQRDIPREKFSYLKELNWFDPSPLPELKDELEQRKEQINRFKELCEKTVDLLNQLQNLLDDPVRFNRLIVKVDEIRSLVNAHQSAMQMVCMVSALADLRRIQHDRRISAANMKDDKERARRQLLRDIEYVQSLADGCDMVIDILDSGLKRIDEKMECNDDGK